MAPRCVCVCMSLAVGPWQVMVRFEPQKRADGKGARVTERRRGTPPDDSRVIMSRRDYLYVLVLCSLTRPSRWAGERGLWSIKLDAGANPSLGGCAKCAFHDFHVSTRSFLQADVVIY